MRPEGKTNFKYIFEVYVYLYADIWDSETVILRKYDISQFRFELQVQQEQKINWSITLSIKVQKRI
jgi:hypothetical protein